MEALLNMFVAPAESVVKHVSLPTGVTLEYVEQGDRGGVPVLLLHGVTDSWRSFEPALPHLPDSLRAIAISLRGHGGSSRPATGYRFVNFAADVRAFLDALEIPAAVLAGHSMSSYVALRVAIDAPERTLGLALMGAFFDMGANAAVRDLWNSPIATLADPVDAAFVEDFQRSTIARPVAPGVVETAVAESLKVPAAVWRATFAEFLESDFSSELHRVQAPTVVMYGQRDAICPCADQAALVAGIGNAQLLVYAGGGHAFHWEEPARFAADLAGFARRAGAGAARASA